MKKIERMEREKVRDIAISWPKVHVQKKKKKITGRKKLHLKHNPLRWFQKQW